MKQKIGMVWRHNEERLPGHRLAVVYGGLKGTDDFSLGHVHETYRVVLGKDEHLGKKRKTSPTWLSQKGRGQRPPWDPLLTSWHLPTSDTSCQKEKYGSQSRVLPSFPPCWPWAFRGPSCMPLGSLSDYELTLLVLPVRSAQLLGTIGTQQDTSFDSDY